MEDLKFSLPSLTLTSLQTVRADIQSSALKSTVESAWAESILGILDLLLSPTFSRSEQRTTTKDTHTHTHTHNKALKRMRMQWLGGVFSCFQNQVISHELQTQATQASKSHDKAQNGMVNQQDICVWISFLFVSSFLYLSMNFSIFFRLLCKTAVVGMEPVIIDPLAHAYSGFDCYVHTRKHARKKKKNPWSFDRWPRQNAGAH